MTPKRHEFTPQRPFNLYFFDAILFNKKSINEIESTIKIKIHFHYKAIIVERGFTISQFLIFKSKCVKLQAIISKNGLYLSRRYRV